MTTITRTSIIALIFSTLSFAGIFPPQEGDLTAEIPFEFVLQGKTLPAGNYIIRSIAQQMGDQLVPTQATSAVSGQPLLAQPALAALPQRR